MFHFNISGFFFLLFRGARSVNSEGIPKRRTFAIFVLARTSGKSNKRIFEMCMVLVAFVGMLHEYFSCVCLRVSKYLSMLHVFLLYFVHQVNGKIWINIIATTFLNGKRRYVVFSRFHWDCFTFSQLCLIYTWEFVTTSNIACISDTKAQLTMFIKFAGSTIPCFFLLSPLSSVFSGCATVKIATSHVSVATFMITFKQQTSQDVAHQLHPSFLDRTIWLIII